MLEYLGLLAPVVDSMLAALFQFAANSLTAPWPALYSLVPLALSSNLPLQLMFLILALMSAICYTHKGAKLSRMLASFLKFVAFTLAPALVLVWTTSPELWSCVSHSLHLVGSDPSHFIHVFDNFPGWTQVILATIENIVRSLTCDDLKLPFLEISFATPPLQLSQMPPS
ncbi:hypothetical protein DSO57_1024929 [Entomophthora muscae]|uniref:Uncharacterized protein n=1 Tax=Entomophthora muscae TaxID=34485 RepID=A0ACC2TDW4_9FUNG|nr:hypothetical protein DSO57_1024929 [Entomophthora muscae]